MLIYTLLIFLGCWEREAEHKVNKKNLERRVAEVLNNAKNRNLYSLIYYGFFFVLSAFKQAKSWNIHTNSRLEMYDFLIEEY